MTVVKTNKNSRKGIVYILTNPCMPDWVKVGSSNKNDIKERLRSLNRLTIVPLKFRVYAVYYVDNSLDIEKKIHAFIDEYLPETRAIETSENGKKRKREFYQLDPKKVFGVFKDIASFRNDLSNLELVVPTESEKKEENTKRSMLILKNIGVPNQAKLSFTKIPTIVCQADNNKNKLIYEGKSYSISGLAKKLLNEKCGKRITTISGSSFFKYKEKTLEEIRREREKE